MSEGFLGDLIEQMEKSEENQQKIPQDHKKSQK